MYNELMTNHRKWSRPGDVAGTYRITITVRPYDGTDPYEVTEEVWAASKRDAFWNLTRRWERLGQHTNGSKSSFGSVVELVG